MAVLATAAAAAAVAGGVAVIAAPAEEYPAADGWVREPAAPKSAPRAAGDPSQAVVSAELAAAAATAGLERGIVHPSDGGGTADCIADWVGDGPADEAQLAALETALKEHGWQVMARNPRPVPKVALISGTWRLELHNGGLLNTATLVATRSTEPCDEAFRREEETRGPRG
ncbi:hypothetical protein ACFCXA_22980 [Streptomyces virginiae]|uniref:hypothetical protein n=1 Tax=Streptomyces virginiae TaxID=1961 RepID=UPI0035E0BAF1